MPELDQVGLSAFEWVEAIRADQRRRWPGGRRVPLEAYLANVAAPLGDEAVLELIYAEVVLRTELGERPELEEYEQRFPQHAEALRRHFAVHRALFSSSASPGSEGDSSAPQGSWVGSRVATRFDGQTPGPGAARCDWPTLTGYEVLGELGRGGMGVVYKARHAALKRLVALKMLLPGEFAGEGVLERFHAEAEAVARLQHPNIVQVFEVSAAEDRPCIALEFVEGGSLEQYLGGKPLPPRQAAGLLQTLARAVHHAHRHNVVHRDLKPANVLLADDGTPKITDFGLAKHTDGSSGRTRTGAIMGTPSYMAPEQADGRTRDIGPATDVYALGAMLYEFLTGRPPFQAAFVLDTLEQVRSQDPVPPSRLQPKVPRDLETVCLKCLEKDPRRRYASAEALADDLGRFLDGQPVRARPVGVLARAWLWCHRPQRVAEVGLWSLLYATLLTFWELCGFFLVLSGSEYTPGAHPGEAWHFLAVIVGFYGPIFVIGAGAVARKAAALWAGAGYSLFLIGFCAACIIGLPFDMAGTFAANPGLKMPLFTLLGILSGLLFGFYLIALLAYYANPRARAPGPRAALPGS
jgi:hypothetical protein